MINWIKTSETLSPINKIVLGYYLPKEKEFWRILTVYRHPKININSEISSEEIWTKVFLFLGKKEKQIVSPPDYWAEINRPDGETKDLSINNISRFEIMDL